MQTLGMKAGTGSFCAGRIFKRMGPMELDVNTLFLVTIYVEAMLGLLLLFAWIQNSGIHAVAWWGCAHLLRAGSVVLFGMYGSVSDAISIDLANAHAVHRLRGDLVGRAGVRRPGAGADVSRRRRGAVASALSHARSSPTRSTPRSCSPPASSPPTPGPRPTNSGAAAASRWCRAGRRSSCCSRMARCSCCARRSSQVLPWSPTSQVFDSVWLTVLSFEALLFTIAIAFILLAMAKERTELRHKTAALVDPLTGIANRRAFLEEVIALSKRQEAEGRSAAVLLADLDHFKSINDRFGHAVGDRVLQIFAAAAGAKLGPDDLIGRLGGEEFAIVLYDAGRERAWRSPSASGCRSRRRGRCRRPRDRRHRQHGHGARRDRPVRHSGAAGPGRRGALLRQGARAKPRRGRLAPACARSHARRLSSAIRRRQSGAGRGGAQRSLNRCADRVTARVRAGGICYDTA